MPEKRQRKSFTANRNTEPARAAEVLPELERGPDIVEEYGLKKDEVPHLKAKQLIGQTFVIVAARQFPSAIRRSRPDAPMPWYCLIRTQEGYRTTVLGGVVVSTSLETWADQGTGAALEVTLDWQEGGEYDGYYVFASDEGGDDTGEPF